MDLFELARENKAEEIKGLIESGADVNITSFNNETPLHWAALAGSCEAALVLIEKGANVNAQTFYFRETPLHLAIQEGKSEMIALLLQNNADPNIRNYEGENSVFLAIRWSNTSILEQLIIGGANPNLYNKTAASPLHLAVDFLDYESAQILLRNLGNPNYQNNEGQTPYHIACAKRNLEFCRLFKAYGADPEIRDAELNNVWKYCDAEFKAEVCGQKEDKPESKRSSSVTSEDSQAWLVNGKCFLCETADADTIVLPCRHKVLCSECAGQFLEEYVKCPKCFMAVYASIKE